MRKENGPRANIAAIVCRHRFFLSRLVLPGPPLNNEPTQYEIVHIIPADVCPGLIQRIKRPVPRAKGVGLKRAHMMEGVRLETLTRPRRQRIYFMRYAVLNNLLHDFKRLARAVSEYLNFPISGGYLIVNNRLVKIIRLSVCSKT